MTETFSASSSRTGERTGEKQTNAPLESLPAEVRHHLLSFLDLSQLRSLVHASPVYHQQYLSGRTLLLCGLLKEMLGASAVDAWAACRASVRRAAGGLTRENSKGTSATVPGPPHFF